MRNSWFLIQKGGIFRSGKEIEELRGGVHRYAAQAKPKIDAAIAEKNLLDRNELKKGYTHTYNKVDA